MDRSRGVASRATVRRNRNSARWSRARGALGRARCSRTTAGRPEPRRAKNASTAARRLLMVAAPRWVPRPVRVFFRCRRQSRTAQSRAAASVRGSPSRAPASLVSASQVRKEAVLRRYLSRVAGPRSVATANRSVKAVSSCARSPGRSGVWRGRPVRVFPEVESEGCCGPGVVFPEVTPAVYFRKRMFPEVRHPAWPQLSYSRVSWHLMTRSLPTPQVELDGGCGTRDECLEVGLGQGRDVNEVAGEG